MHSGASSNNTSHISIALITQTAKAFKVPHPSEINAEKTAREEKKKPCPISRINAPVVLEGVTPALFTRVS